MPIIINPGSENKGGTFKQALKNAKRWFKNIKAEYPEVVMTTKENKTDEKGMWTFTFTHKTTKKSVDLEIHGFTAKEAESFTFRPREYWNGSSTEDPEIKNWLTDKFTYRILYEPK